MSQSPLPKKIWLAGLGAISRAEQEGEQWLEELMREGEAYELEKKEELDQAFLNMTDKIKDGKSRVKQQFDNIEQTFETKVSSTLHKLGMASKDELRALRKRLEDIEDKFKNND